MVENSDLGGFDFETWAALAKSDPARFEQARTAILEATLGAAANISRLRALQNRIDLERRRARTPIKSCLRLCSMMWDSLLSLQRSLVDNGFSPPLEGQTATTHHRLAGRVISFPNVGGSNGIRRPRT
jgi:Protein of unknown function (DUF3135)